MNTYYKDYIAMKRVHIIVDKNQMPKADFLKSFLSSEKAKLSLTIFL